MTVPPKLLVPVTVTTALSCTTTDAVPPIDPRESIAMANLVRDESPPDVIVRFQRSSTYITRPRMPWAVISAMLVAAVGLGMGVAFLAF